MLVPTRSRRYSVYRQVMGTVRQAGVVAVVSVADYDSGADPPPSPPAILVTGATGFIGSRLVPALLDEGHEVRAMTRRPEAYDGPGTAVGGDVNDASTLGPALDGVDVAYYLVHSLDSPDFETRDARAARSFGEAAAEAGVRQIVFLGGLGAEEAQLSAHLRSRREVEGLLGDGGVPVTVLRAGIVVGRVASRGS